MKSADLIRQLRASVDARADLVMEHFLLRYGEHKFEFVRLTSENFRTSFRPEKWFLITAGFHGNEKAGPLTIFHKLDEITDYAHSRGIGLVIYPLINPSGFDADQRYGLGGKGEHGNNDFVRYVLVDGRIVDDLGDQRDGLRFISWHPAVCGSYSGYSKDLRPIETIRLHACIQYDPKYYGTFAGAIDLHQDRFLVGPAGYHYALGKNLSCYTEIVKKVESVVGRIFRNMEVDSGEGSSATSDANGCVNRHDGSVTDWLHRLGVPHTVAVETTGDTPMDKAIEVNMIWIRGLIDLVA